MPAPTAILNSEPADPEVREEKHLPPKSYADAADPSVNGDGSGKGSGKGIWKGTRGSKDSMSVKRPDFEREESSHEYSAEVKDWIFPPNYLQIY